MADNPWHNLFAENRARRAQLTYGIAFTPRSGSSWLSELLAATGILGNPVEWFNPGARVGAAELSDCDNLDDYFGYLERTRTLGGVFGFEVTWNQLRSALDAGGTRRFKGVEHWFYLRRRRFLKQAISLYRAEYSGLFHSSQRDGDPGEAPYDARKIARCVLRLMHQEAGFAQWFRQREIEARLLWYEEITKAPEDCVRLVGEALGRDKNALEQALTAAPPPTLEKLPGGNANQLISRFRAENRAFVDYWQRWRGVHHVARFRKTHPELAAIAGLSEINISVDE